MYAYLLVAVVVLFTLYKYDLKEGFPDKTINEMEYKKGNGSTSSKSDQGINWSAYVLKSSIPTCPSNGGSALQFSGDPDFKNLENCYSKHKPQGGSLKMKDFIKCIYPEFKDSEPAKVPTTQTKSTTATTSGKSADSGISEFFEDAKDFVKDNLVYVVIGVSIIIAAIIVSSMSSSSIPVAQAY